jgi:ferredoxin-NADP reductase
MKLKLEQVKPEAGDVRSFVFISEEPLSWNAGQYLHYTIPGTNQDGQEDNRYFTISAAPSEGHVMISTRLFEAPSHFKQALKNLKPGDEIEADGPEGDFIIDDSSRNHIFIAGGIGITPFRSILVEAAANGQPLNVHLLYATRDENIFFKDELEALAQKNPNLRISYIVQPELLDAERLKKELTAVADPYVYVSGPEPMVEAMDKQLEELGISKDNIKSDYFPGYKAD